MRGLTLEAELLLLKIELNGCYGKNPPVELSRAKAIYTRMNEIHLAICERGSDEQ